MTEQDLFDALLDLKIYAVINIQTGRIAGNLIFQDKKEALRRCSDEYELKELIISPKLPK